MSEGPYPNHLARFMRAKRITDPDLARRLDPPISKQQIFNLRKGLRKLTVEWAKRLAVPLEIPWQELITGMPAQPTDRERAALIAAYDALPDEQRRAVMTMITGLLPKGVPIDGHPRFFLGAGASLQGRPDRQIVPGAATTTSEEPLTPQVIDRADELAWVAFWRALRREDRREVLRMLNLSDRATV